MGIEVNVMFPARLRTLMQKGIDGKRVTQQDLATATGYTRQAISLYLDGSVLPNVEKLCAIADFFGVSADYLLGLSDTSTSDKDVSFICEYTGLNENTVQFLHRFLETYGEGIAKVLDILADDEESSFLTAEMLDDAVYRFEYGSFLSAFRNYLRGDFSDKKTLYFLPDGRVTASRDEVQAAEGNRLPVEHITRGELTEQILQRRLLSTAQAIKAKCEAGEIDGSV